MTQKIKTTDRELLELAAKAAEIEYTANDNPLVSDALALRMAVRERNSNRRDVISPPTPTG